MNLTEETFQQFLHTKQQIENHILETIREKQVIETGNNYIGDMIENITYEGDTIEVVMNQSSRYTTYGDDAMYWEVPTRYLFEDSWREEVEKEVKEKQEYEEWKKKQEENEKRERQVERDKKEYERLKLLFEQES